MLVSEPWGEGRGREVGDGPCFIILGAMKAGSTTLYRRLSAHPATRLPRTKEPAFFNSRDLSPSALATYLSSFQTGVVSGEATVAYSDPLVAALVAERMRMVLPNVKLVFLARHPVDRLRSHYLHEALRARERRSFNAAVSQPGNVYVRRSSYAQAMRPFLRAFPSEQTLIVRSELLDSLEQWERILAFLGLGPAPLNEVRHNRTAGKEMETRLMRLLRTTGLLERVGTLPPSIRKIGQQAVTRRAVFRGQVDSLGYRQDAATGRLPEDVARLLFREAEDFAALAGWQAVPWDFAE